MTLAPIQLRRNTKVVWEGNNPVLKNGEPGFVVDTGELKIGDGGTPWNDLPYASISEDFVNLIVSESIEPINESIDELETEVGSAAKVNESNTFSSAQNFSPNGAFTVGDLRVKRTDGYAGQRLHLTGTSVGVMPYIEVVPTTKTGTDVGGSVAGIQVYNTTYGGEQGVPEREFIALEAKGDLYSGGRMFRLGTWASGTGQKLPFRIGVGDQNLVDFVANGAVDAEVRILPTTRMVARDGTVNNTFDVQRDIAGTAYRAATSSSGAATSSAAVFLGRTRGTRAAPTAVTTNDRLGAINFGSYQAGTPVSDATQATTAYIRGEARESYSNWSTARGSQIRLGVTLVGTPDPVDAQVIADPSNDTETAILIMVNRAGTKTLSRVSVGPVDSAGTGYRALRVAN